MSGVLVGRTGRCAGHTQSPRRRRAPRGQASTRSTAHFHPGRQNQRVGPETGSVPPCDLEWVRKTLGTLPSRWALEMPGAEV